MSALRPTLITDRSNTPCISNGTAYFAILNSVREKDGLLHGKLEDGHGHFCAIGSYFDNNPKTALPNDLIDEVAAVNDSMPNATAKQRKYRVMQWLRWKCKQLGMLS